MFSPPHCSLKWGVVLSCLYFHWIEWLFSFVTVPGKDIQVFKATGNYFIYSNLTSSITQVRKHHHVFFSSVPEFEMWRQSEGREFCWWGSCCPSTHSHTIQGVAHTPPKTLLLGLSESWVALPTPCSPHLNPPHPSGSPWGFCSRVSVVRFQ